MDESRLTRIEAVINSMTAAERNDHNLIDGKRRNVSPAAAALPSRTSIRF